MYYLLLYLQFFFLFPYAYLIINYESPKHNIFLIPKLDADLNPNNKPLYSAIIHFCWKKL